MTSAETRLPLEDTTNSPSTSPPETIRGSPHRLHRKRTQHDLNANLDSSESCPSPHSSLYDASLLHSTPPASPTPETYITTERKNEIPSPDITGDDLEPAWLNTVAGDDGSPIPASFLASPSRKVTQHIPHKLYPITEQSSLATLRSRLSINSISTLRPRQRSRSRSRSPGLAAVHKRSFSLTDLPPPEEVPNSSESSAPPPPDAPLPQPNEPVSSPPVRSPTPPNLPTFGTKQAMTYRLPPPPKPKNSFFSNETPQQREWRRQTTKLPKGAIMRGENGTLVRGSFKGIRSGHLPPQRTTHREMVLPQNPANEVWMGSNSRTGVARAGPTERERDSQVGIGEEARAEGQTENEGERMIRDEQDGGCGALFYGCCLRVFSSKA